MNSEPAEKSRDGPDAERDHSVSIDENSNINMSETSYEGGGERVEKLGEPSEPPADGPDWRGWLLVGVVVIATIIAPALIYLSPPQLPFEFSYLVLPLIPAFLLGGTAVWVAVQSRRGK